MLSKLTVENYALIKQLEIDFSNGFNVITGETGAGKSIIVGAMSMLFGQRADANVLMDTTKKCVIEGTFNIAGISLQPLFEEHDLDYDQTLIIRREITPQGKSRAFVNDTPVNLSILKMFAEKLIDIHSQHHSLLLNESSFQLNLVDQFASNQQLLAAYAKSYLQYVETKKRLEILIASEQQSKNDRDYFAFLFDEISELNPQPNEEELLENEMNFLTHAESIKSVMYQVNSQLSDHDFAVLNQLADLKTLLQPLQSVHPLSAELKSRIDSCYIELKDISTEAASIADDVSFDSNRLQKVTLRLDALNKLFLKHRVATADEILTIAQDLDEKLLAISSLDLEIEKLTKSLANIKESLNKDAQSLSNSRKKCLPSMEKEIVDVLVQLGMQNCEIIVQITPKSNFSVNGVDDVQILFSANKGQQPRPLEKVASGGEISRLMLAVKSLIHARNLIPIAIFDEIDTGVSGDVAAKVANILAKMSASMQIIAISHLPQIAAKADTHLWVYKEIEDDKTKSNIKSLNTTERINEIAQMISGEKITPAAIETAKALLSEI